APWKWDRQTSLSSCRAKNEGGEAIRGEESPVRAPGEERGCTMRRIRYQVACSLDGYISGPNGEIDWIPMDPDIDFGALLDQFDTLLMGRRTFEELPEDAPGFEDKRIIVVSRTLRQDEAPG